MNLPQGIGSLSAGDTIPASELTALATSAQDQLVDTCDIWRSSKVDDGQGTTTDTWAAQATGVACRLSKPKDQREAVQGAGLIALTVWTLDLPTGTDLRIADRVVKSSLTYNVIDTDAGRTNPVFLSAQVVRATR